MDNINHPAHYNQSGRKECIVEMEELFGVYPVFLFCILNAYKYRYRAGLKEGSSSAQDLAKAEWYENYAEKTLGNKINDATLDFIRRGGFVNEDSGTER